MPVLRRLRSLAVLELLNVPLQAGVWFGILGVPVTLANVVGYGLVALLLVEGAGYWLAKLRQLDAHLRELPWLEAFRFARVANPVLLTAGVVLTGYEVARDPGWTTVPGLLFALFAVLEHVNYFSVQLMHDNLPDLRRLFRSGFHRSHLHRDLTARRP